MPDISSRDFGRLEADVRNLSELLRSIDNKMNGVVTRAEFLAAFDELNKTQSLQNDRIDQLEQHEAMRSNSIWARIGTAADANFVSVMGKVVFVIIAALILGYFTSNYQIAPQDTNATHDAVKE